MTQRSPGYVPDSVTAFPESGFVGLILDFDDTITSPMITTGKLRGQKIHDISRVLAAREVGIELGNEILMSLTPAQSEESYVKAAEPTLESSIAYLFHRAGIFSSHIDYDPADERLIRLTEKRSHLHTELLKRFVELNSGAESLLMTAQERLKCGIAVASMAKLSDIQIVFERFGLDAYIPDDRIVSGDLVRKPKPHREAFDTAYHRLGVQATGNAKLDSLERKRVIGVDDSRGGVASAASAGIFAVGIASNMPAEAFRGSSAALVVPSLVAVKKTIEKHAA